MQTETITSPPVIFTPNTINEIKRLMGEKDFNHNQYLALA